MARFDAFYNNLAAIVDINLDPNTTFVAGLNKFSDQTEKEFADTVLMKVNPPDKINGGGQMPEDNSNPDLSIKGESPMKATVAMINVSNAPPSERLVNKDQSRRLLQVASFVDHRATGMTTPVRDQGSCACCWAFAATAVVESAVLLSGATVNRTSVSLSQQQLVDCTKENTRSGLGGMESKGCEGGM